LELLRVMLPWVPRPTMIWLIAGLGLTALFWNRHGREHYVFVLGFALFSTLAVIPGLYFRPHYFLVMLPAAAMLAGLGISAAFEYLQQRGVSAATASIPIVFFIVSYLAALHGQRKYLFQMSPDEVNREMHEGHGFPEAVAIADYVRNHTQEQDRVAILGSEPEIYFYSHRHSATGYIYMYPLLEKQKYALRMQSEMIHEIEERQPKIVIFTDNQLTWGWAPEWTSSEPRVNVFNWMLTYLSAHYDLMAEVPIPGATDQLWSAPPRYYIFQRK
jgi:hypothetical protein